MNVHILENHLPYIKRIVSSFFIDPVFEREVSFEKYSAKYEWRIFNHAYCNHKTYGHCYTNQTNKQNAEIELHKQMLEDYDRDEKIAQKLKHFVHSSYRAKRAYNNLTKSDDVEIDSLKKYKADIFKRYILK